MQRLFQYLIQFISSEFKIHLSEKDEYILNLPIRYGGFGLTDLSALCDIAYSVSCYSVSTNLSEDCFPVPAARDRALLILGKDDTNEYFANALKPQTQWALCNIIHVESVSKLKSTLSPTEHIFFKYNTLPFSGSFLTVCPANTFSGFNDSEFRFLSHLRLLKLVDLPICSNCGFKNIASAHSINCNRTSKAVIGRHDRCKMFLAKLLDIPNSDIEISLRSDSIIGKADFLLRNPTRFVDVTVIGGHGHELDLALQAAVVRKKTKYASLVKDGIVKEVCPIVFSILGEIEKATLKQLKPWKLNSYDMTILSCIIAKGSYRCHLAYESYSRKMVSVRN
ncbi:hypothetical protein P9112_000224 [Eukaryota sp. TZLM1-RC]